MTKSLTSLWQHIAQDLGNGCGTSTVRDLETVLERVDTEGDSFLTITLAAFCKDFEKSLDEGGVGPSAFCGFHRRGGLPVFLRGFLSQVFDTDSGALLDEPSTYAIFAVRQLTLLFSKIAFECTERRTQAAYRSFIECEQELKQRDREWSGQTGFLAHWSISEAWLCACSDPYSTTYKDCTYRISWFRSMVLAPRLKGYLATLSIPSLHGRTGLSELSIMWITLSQAYDTINWCRVCSSSNPGTRFPLG